MKLHMNQRYLLEDIRYDEAEMPAVILRYAPALDVRYACRPSGPLAPRAALFHEAGLILGVIRIIIWTGKKLGNSHYAHLYSGANF